MSCHKLLAMGGHRLLLFWLLLCGASGVSKDECRAGDEVSALQRQILGC